jgi:hypothetical protein
MALKMLMPKWIKYTITVTLLLEQVKKNLKHTSQIADLKNTDSNFMGYAEYGFTLLSNLTKAYKGTTVEGKQKMMGSIFPDKLIFDGKKYRTPVQNELLGLLLNSPKDFEGLKMQKVGKSSDQFAKVALMLEVSSPKLIDFIAIDGKI